MRDGEWRSREQGARSKEQGARSEGRIEDRGRRWGNRGTRSWELGFGVREKWEVRLKEEVVWG